MATPFRIKRSSVAGKRPALEDLQLGELALNFNDGRLFARKENVGIGSTVSLLNVWTENIGGGAYYTEGNIGIGTTLPISKLTIVGDGLFTGIVTAAGINVGPVSGSGANFTNLYVSGVTTSLVGFIGNLNSSGVSTVGSLNIGAIQVISSGRQLQNISSLDAVTIATIESAISNSPNTFTDIRVTGISTLGVTSVTNLTTQQINSSGIVTASTFSGNLQNTLTLNTSGIGLSGSTTFNNSGASTFTVTSNATSSNTGGTLVSRDASGNFIAGVITATTFSGALQGNSTTATTLQNSRTISLSGDVVGSVSFNGSSDVSIAATIQPNSVALGDDTTGNYVSSITNGSYITGGNGGSESAALTIGVAATSTNTANQVVARDSSGNFSAGTITANLTGTATSTTNIPNLSGDITSNNTVTTLATVNSNVGTFGGTGSIPVVTVNAKGLVTGVSTVAPNNGTLTLAVSGTGLSGSATFTANQAGNSTFTVTSNATSDNTASAIVSRNGLGGFSAGIITATTFNGNLTGNVTGNLNSSGVNTATTLSGTTATYTTGNFTTGNIVTGIVTTISGTQSTYTNATIGVGTVTTLNYGTVAGISNIITTVATTAATTIDSFSTTVFRSARVQVQITQGTNYQASDILIIHDGASAFIVEYGSIATGNSYLGNFTSAVSAGNCLLQINMSSATSATIKVLSQRITI